MNTQGRIYCQELLFNRGNGIKCFDGPTQTASVTPSGDMTCNSLSVINTSGTPSTVASISQDGDLTRTSLRIGTWQWQPTVETVVLNCVNPTSPVTSSMARIPGWNYIRSGNGRNFKISFQITCYTTNAGSIGEWYLRKGIPDSGQSSIVATGRFFHNNTSIHTTMPTLYYVDTPRPTIDMEYFVARGANTTIDTNDICIMTTTEYY